MTPSVPLALREGPTLGRAVRGSASASGPPAPSAPFPSPSTPSPSAPSAAPLVPGPGRAPAPGRVPVPRRSVPVPAGRVRRYRLRGRHVREHRLVRVGLALAAADIAVADDLLVLQVLRLRPLADLDAAQVCALSALPPSVVASSLDRLVRSGLAKDRLVDGRVRFGLP